MLSRFGSRSPLPPAAATTATTDALSDAIKSFQNCLEPEQKARLEAIKAVPDAHAVAEFTHQLDQENAKRKSRCVAARISPLLESIQQFSGVVETFVSSNPHIAALVWGSVKLVLQIASNFTNYFDNLSALLMTIGKRCPRFEEYQRLYRDSTDLQKVLCDFYSVVVRCCEQAVTVLRRTGYIQLLKAVTSSFESEFASIMVQIHQASQEVDATIRLAEAKLTKTEREVQHTEREAAERFRLSSMLYRKERERIEADRMAQMQLEKHKIQQATKLELFCDYNHKIAYWKARTQRHGSTGRWLTQTDDFRRWVTVNSSTVFWFTGILGSGKTVMTAYVVEQLSANSNQGTERLAYFFCQYDNQTSLRASTVLRSIVKQLIDQDDQIFTANSIKIDALIDNPHDLTLLVALFSSILESLKSVVVVLDGIDECSSSEMKFLLKALRGLMLQKPSGLKLYLSGDDRITDLIVSFLTPSFVVNTHTPEAASDLQGLIEQLVTARRADGDLVTGDPRLYQEVIDVLCAASKGMILWVKFQLEEICSQKTDESIRSALNHLPKDLSETYNRLLSRVVEEGSVEMCNKIFRFMAAAKRPLSPEELSEAISVEPCQPYFMPERLLNDINGIVRWCHGLIVLSELDDTIQFTHSSVKDFLCGLETERIAPSDFHIEANEADRQFGEICVTYLNFNDFKTQLVKYYEPAAPLDPMAMASLALDAGCPSIFLNQAKHIIRRRAKSAPASTRLLSLKTNNRMSQELTAKYQLLQYASEFWLSHTTEFLPDQNTWTLFRKLAEERYYSISDPVVRTPRGPLPRNGLCKFIFTHEHKALFHLYLIRDFSDNNLASILASTLTHKYYSWIRLLPPLAKKQSDLRWQELVLSISTFDLFQTIEMSDAHWLEDLTITERSSILMKVIRITQDDLTVNIKLIELGVDPYHKWNDNWQTETLLEELIRQSDSTMLQHLCAIMVRSGADFNRKIAQDGRNAFHIAGASRNPAAVAALLRYHNAESLIDSTDDYGRTALHLAVRGEERIPPNPSPTNTVVMLLKMRATPEKRDASGKTALEYASRGEADVLRKEFSKYYNPGEEFMGISNIGKGTSYT